MCQLIQLESGGTAFVCGCGKTNDHVCNEDSAVLILSDGNRVSDTKENQEKYMEQVRGGSVCCSICGRAAIDNAVWI